MRISDRQAPYDQERPGSSNRNVGIGLRPTAVIAVSPPGTRKLTRQWRSCTNQRGDELIELCATSTGRWPSSFGTLDYELRDSPPHSVAAHSDEVEGDEGEGGKETRKETV